MADRWNEYREMADKVSLSSEKKGTILEAAKQKAVIVRRKRRRTMLAVLLCLVMFAGTGSVVTYATTGKSPMEFLNTLFRKADDEYISILGRELKEPEEVYVIENWKVALERYWFNKEEGILIAEISLETLDGGPLIDPNLEFVKHAKKLGYDPSQFYTISSKFEANEWWLLSQEYTKGDHNKTWYMRGYAGLDPKYETDPPILSVQVHCGTTWKELEFELENTGELKQRTLDASYLENGVSMELNAMRLKIMTEEKMEEGRPIRYEIHMKNGRCFTYGIGIYDEDGIIYGEGDEYPMGEQYGYALTFGNSLIHVDEVEKVIFNGVEIPFLD